MAIELTEMAGRVRDSLDDNLPGGTRTWTRGLAAGSLLTGAVLPHLQRRWRRNPLQRQVQPQRRTLLRLGRVAAPELGVELEHGFPRLFGVRTLGLFDRLNESVSKIINVLVHHKSSHSII